MRWSPKLTNTLYYTMTNLPIPITINITVTNHFICECTKSHGVSSDTNCNLYITNCNCYYSNNVNSSFFLLYVIYLTFKEDTNHSANLSSVSRMGKVIQQSDTNTNINITHKNENSSSNKNKKIQNTLINY